MAAAFSLSLQRQQHARQGTDNLLSYMHCYCDWDALIANYVDTYALVMGRRDLKTSYLSVRANDGSTVLPAIDYTLNLRFPDETLIAEECEIWISVCGRG